MKIDLVSASIRLGGDQGTTVVCRGVTNPIMWPEVAVLLYTHGDGAVTDITVVGSEEMPKQECVRRIGAKYGGAIAGLMFPGANPGVEGEAPVHIPRAKGLPKRRAKKVETPAPEQVQEDDAEDLEDLLKD